MKILSIVVFLVCLAFPLLGDKAIPGQDYRILKLLPDPYYTLAIEPAIPEHFVAASPSGELDLNEWIYWGPKDVLEKYFENPNSLDQPLIRIKMTVNRAQTGPDNFTGTDDDIKEFKVKLHSSENLKWGNYPVHAIKGTMFHKVICVAWIGLNYPQGETLLCNLVYPPQQSQPKKKDYQLWNTFIRKSKPLFPYGAF